MNNIWEKKLKELPFKPFNFATCASICEKIYATNELREFLQENMIDDLSVSWSGIFLHQAYHFQKEIDWSTYNERMNSVLYSSLEAQTMQLEWVVFSILYGQYEVALRELRNIIESSFLFYRIDYLEENRKLSGEEKFKKLNALPENQTFGRKVFELSMYKQWNDVYQNVYKKLCYFTHTKISSERAEENYPQYNGLLEPNYDELMVKKCLFYLQKVLLIEIDMLDTQLKEVYGLNTKSAFDKIFNKIMMPEP